MIAAQGEGKELLRTVVDARRVGIEVEVEKRIAFGGARSDRFFRQVVVARDFVDGESLFGERIRPVARYRKQQLRRVEDRLVPEILVRDVVIVEVLREESGRAQPQRIVELRTEVSRREVRREDRIGLEQPRLDILLGVDALFGEGRESHAHLLVLRNEVAAQRIVDLGAARHEGGRSEHGSGRAEQGATEVIVILHRIGCN